MRQCGLKAQTPRSEGRDETEGIGHEHRREDAQDREVGKTSSHILISTPQAAGLTL